jgi:hypothetical protein
LRAQLAIPTPKNKANISPIKAIVTPPITQRGKAYHPHSPIFASIFLAFHFLYIHPPFPFNPIFPSIFPSIPDPLSHSRGEKQPFSLLPHPSPKGIHHRPPWRVFSNSAQFPSIFAFFDLLKQQITKRVGIAVFVWCSIGRTQTKHTFV